MSLAQRPDLAIYIGWLYKHSMFYDTDELPLYAPLMRTTTPGYPLLTLCKCMYGRVHAFD